jgi:hypothetical protein
MDGAVEFFVFIALLNQNKGALALSARTIWSEPARRDQGVKTTCRRLGRVCKIDLAQGKLTLSNRGA